MYIRTALCFLFALFLCNQIKSQNQVEQGIVHLRIYGVRNPAFKIDDKVMHASDTTVSLSSGNHHLKIWWPTATLIDTTIVIKGGDTAKYSFEMKPSPVYLKYKSEYADYKRLENKRYYISPIWIGSTIGLGMIVNQFYAKKQYDLALRSKEIYLGIGNQAQMNEQKDHFETYKNKYYKYKKLEYGLYSVSGLLVANYIRIIIKQKHTAVPHFKEENLLSKIDFNVYPSFKYRSLQYGLTFNF